jgi:hypothetical protein
MSTTSKRPGNDWEIGFCKWLAEKILDEKETSLTRITTLIQFKHGMKPSTSRTSYLDEWIRAGLIKINEDGIITVIDEPFFRELMGIASDELKNINKNKELNKEPKPKKKDKTVKEMVNPGERDRAKYKFYVKECEKAKEKPMSYDEWLNELYKEKEDL